ncbi:hypothetical protein [Streptomyces paludis]|uniref:Uncharacterized protein n=1 Tax=Streptomyces paludis TaxID=2282738 RepID=A0A345HUJ9_9ACTN|nr:hypothetical protein [Streptomyces paludis]AXG80373.1 hypothetical protein DVK44_24935 [Streptomyces paludis]
MSTQPDRNSVWALSGAARASVVVAPFLLAAVVHTALTGGLAPATGALFLVEALFFGYPVYLMAGTLRGRQAHCVLAWALAGLTGYLSTAQRLSEQPLPGWQLAGQLPAAAVTAACASGIGYVLARRTQV